MSTKKRTHNFDDDLAPKTKRQKTSKSQKKTRDQKTRDHRNYHYKRPNASLLSDAFDEMLKKLSDDVGGMASYQQDIDQNHIKVWRDLLSAKNINEQHPENDNMDYLISTLSREDYHELATLYALSLEILRTAVPALKLTNHCIEFINKKMEQQKYEKMNQYEQEKKERDEINNKRIPTKDIWSQMERTNYFRVHNKAAIKTEIHKHKTQYIVCKIFDINHHKQECSLIDADNQQQYKYTVSFKHIIPLPSLTSVSLAKRTIFQAGTKVLAVYPATTCFYPATIIEPPKGSTKYTLRFEDDGDKIKQIEAEQIMPYVS